MKLLFQRRYKIYTATKEYVCNLCNKPIEKGGKYATSGTLRAHLPCYWERYEEFVPEHEKVLFKEVEQ